MGDVSLSSSSFRMPFKFLKLAIPILLHARARPRRQEPPLEGSLRHFHPRQSPDEYGGAIGRHPKRVIQDVRDRVGVGVAHLLHESLRVRNFSPKVDMLDEENAAALRKFCLTFYDIRAVKLNLAVKLDVMRHLNSLTRYQ